MDHVARRYRLDAAVRLDQQAAVRVNVSGKAGQRRCVRQFHPDLMADRRREVAVLTKQAYSFGIRLLSQGLVPRSEGSQYLDKQDVPLHGHALGEQRGRRQAARSDRELLGGGGDVDADADHDRVAGRLREDAGELTAADEQVVRPLEARVEAGQHADAGGGGDAGDQRQPAALRGRDPVRPQQHGKGERGARRADPRSAHSAPAGGLLLGDQDGTLGEPARRPLQQVGVRGAGPRRDLDGAPGAAQARQFQGEPGLVERLAEISH